MDFEGEFLFTARAPTYTDRIVAANSRETHG